MSDPLELELEAVMSHPQWVLGSEPGSSGKATELSLQPRLKVLY